MRFRDRLGRRSSEATSSPVAVGTSLASEVRARAQLLETKLVDQQPLRAALDSVILAQLPPGKARLKFASQMDESPFYRSFGPLFRLQHSLRDIETHTRSAWYDAKGVVAAAPNWRAIECWAVVSLFTDSVLGIGALKAWNNSDIDAAGLRVDLTEQLVDVATQMLESSAVEVALGEPPAGTTPEAIHARQVVQQQRGVIDTVRSHALLRLDALRTYQSRIAALDAQTEHVRQIDRAGLLDHRIDTLVHRTGRDDISRTELGRAATDLQEATLARSAALAEIRGDYLALLQP